MTITKTLTPGHLGVCGRILGALLIIMWCLSGCSGKDHDSHEERNGHEEHGEHEENGGHDEHGHGEGGESDLDKALEEILADRCEHDVYSYHCDECRYEVGVVKVDPGLIKGKEGSGGGLIQFEPATLSKMRSVLVTTGEVSFNGNRTVRMSAPVSGVVDSVAVDVGQRVKKDDILYEIRSAELVGILGEYRRASNMSYLSGKNYRRERSLYKKKISSEQEMIDSKMAYRGHQAEFASAKHKLAALGLTEEDIKTEEPGTLGLLAVRAPIDGTITKKDVAPNETVEPGRELLVVADLSTLWVWADVYEKDIASLIEAKKKSDVRAMVRLDSFPGRSFDGDLDYIGATMEESTRTIKVRVLVDNADGLLRPGMFCEVHIPISLSAEALVIPKEAVLSDEGEDFVFKHLEGDYWVRRRVVKGRAFEDKVEILEGLEPGEVIAVQGSFLLKSDVLREKMGAGCAD